MNARILCCAVVGGFAAVAPACCITYANVVMTLSKETAIIIWDQEKKIEHFVRRSEFEGEARDFGFIFPSPTRPFRIEVANADAFTTLEHVHVSNGIGCNKSEAEAGAVEVLEQRKVGDFEVTVLRADQGSALGQWLKKHGHYMRPAMVPWLDFYARRKWVFTAFRYAAKPSQTPTKAVCISFKADQPHYPYKMPSDTWEAKHYRPLDLYVVSQSAMDGEYVAGGAWQADRRWAEDLKDSDRQGLLDKLTEAGPGVDLPKNLVVTRFSNTPEATD
jgi:hypothetical protein